MTIQEAWRYIAEAYYTQMIERNKRQRWIAHLGICRAIRLICGYNMITYEQFSAMREIPIREIEARNLLLPETCSLVYFCRRNREGDFLRGDWCYLQSLLSDDEM